MPGLLSGPIPNGDTGVGLAEMNTNRRLRIMLFAAFLIVTSRATLGGVLHGVEMPDSQIVNGIHLVLNGLALRTYSFLRVPIYVAGLYLEHPTADANAILTSHQIKLFRFVFVRDIDAEDARKSWRENLDRSCAIPCRLSTDAIARFLASIPQIHKGDTNTFLFTSGHLDVAINGRSLGQITDPDFMKVILSSFVGPHPGSPQVKRELLGTPE